MPDRTSKRPRDLNQLAASIVGDATDGAASLADRQRIVDEIAEKWGPEAARNFLSAAGSSLPDWFLDQLAEAQDGAIPSVSEVVASNAALGRFMEGLRLPKDPAAVSLGRKGGLKGGKARAAKLSPERRSEIARKAAAARWGDKPSG